MNVPQDLKYTTDHEWARLDGKTARIGITAFAVEQLGDITLIELPPVGTVLTAGQIFGTIESVKSVSDLYAPVSGTVNKVNDALVDHPELINDSPYDTGWMLELCPASDTEQLLSPAAYLSSLAEDSAS